jgi:elongation factor 2
MISTYECDDMGESQQVDPTKGTVAFGSGYFGWAFTLTHFARIYADKYKVDKAKMMSRLWSDNFFDAKGKVWKTNDTGSDGT